MALYKNKEESAVIKFATINENGEVDIDEFKKQISEKLK